jgi:hypothetical protein
MGCRLFVEASHAPHKSERVPRLELRPTLALDKAPLLALLPRSPGAKGSRTAVQAVAGRRPTDPALASKSFERFPQLADPANAPRCPCPRIVARRRQECVLASRALRLLTYTRKVDEVSTGSESDYANCMRSLQRTARLMHSEQLGSPGSSRQRGTSTSAKWTRNTSWTAST